MVSEFDEKSEEGINIACSLDRAGYVVLYLISLSEREYEFLPDEDKRVTLKWHRHFKECKVCYNGLNYVKGRFASVGGGFSGRQFALLKMNEKYLDSLV